MKTRSTAVTYHCKAPAKLIISGEHAVLYDCPALSLAIQRYSHCLSHFDFTHDFSLKIKLPDFQITESFSLDEFKTTALAIHQRYTQFQAGELTIAEVLKAPTDLVICALSLFEQSHSLKHGNWQFELHSDIPMGMGLGSSASIIVSLIKVLDAQHNTELSHDSLLALAKEIESYQHGKSSGLDPATILNGGAIHYNVNQTIQLPELNQLKVWLIETGTPQSSTGEAVMHVQQFANETELWQKFKQTTLAIEQALIQNATDTLTLEISHNQRLLEQIGIVPKHVKAFIQELEVNYNAHAKICGSGAVRGEKAGVILCLSERNPEALCQQYNYPCQAIEIDTNGAICQGQLEPLNQQGQA